MGQVLSIQFAIKHIQKNSRQIGHFAESIDNMILFVLLLYTL